MFFQKVERKKLITLKKIEGNKGEQLIYNLLCETIW